MQPSGQQTPEQYNYLDNKHQNNTTIWTTNTRAIQLSGQQTTEQYNYLNNKH